MNLNYYQRALLWVAGMFGLVCGSYITMRSGGVGGTPLLIAGVFALYLVLGQAPVNRGKGLRFLPFMAKEAGAKDPDPVGALVYGPLLWMASGRVPFREDLNLQTGDVLIDHAPLLRLFHKLFVYNAMLNDFLGGGQGDLLLLKQQEKLEQTEGPLSDVFANLMGLQANLFEKFREEKLKAEASNEEFVDFATFVAPVLADQLGIFDTLGDTPKNRKKVVTYLGSELARAREEVSEFWLQLAPVVTVNRDMFLRWANRG